MRSIGRRVAELDAEITALDTDLRALVTTTAPTLTGLYGVGVNIAGQLLVTAGGNPDRLHSKSRPGPPAGHRAHPRLQRHHHPPPAPPRRQLRRAPHRHRPATPRPTHPPLRRQAHRPRQTKPMIIRSLKRYLVRDICRTLNTDLNNLTSTPAAA
ncbi:MAG: hypothetical protein ACRDS1_17655 [Pseudonocardiaceae bacterium]